MSLIRSVYRTALLVFLLLMARVDGWARTLFFGLEAGPAGAVWVHLWCRRIVRALGLACTVEGRVPEAGPEGLALVSNHLSYLDILIYSSLRPMVMVAKSEVRDWPLLGWITAQAGTVYVERSDVKGGRTQTHAEVNGLMAEAFRGGLPVLFFPEGTTTCGTEVLPFRRGLYHSVLADAVPVGVAAIEYTLAAGNGEASVGKEVCYWGEMEFVPHLVACLGLRGIGVHVGFEAGEVAGRDRFALAAGSHHAVCDLRQRLARRAVAAAEAAEQESAALSVADRVGMTR